MSLVSQHRASARRCFAVGAFCALSLLALTTRAQAAELVYWDNYGATPATIAFAEINGSGGSALNLSGTAIEGPEGIAFDSVTGRVYVSASEGPSGGKGQIVWVNADGSGAGVLATPGVEVVEPYGVAIDPIARMAYWVNNGGGPEGKGSIGFAKLDGSGGGVLNTAGVTVEGPYKLAIDPVSGKVFWGNYPGGSPTIAYANLNNTGGGGTLSLSGATAPAGIRALAVDSGAGRVYWLDSNGKRISSASVNGGSGSDIDLSGASLNNGYGLAIDPVLGKMYWANYGNSEDRTNAIGFSALGGGSFGGISPVTAPLAGPQDPIILKSPTGTGAPVIARDAKNRSTLTCSSGTWAADYAGAFVYQAPRTLAYQWTLDGAPIAGATAPILEAAKPGGYACAVTAANQAGAASQASAPIVVKAAKVKLTTKKKARVKAGGVATFKVKGVNQGDLKSKKARVCVKVPKKAKADLKAKPKCKVLGRVKGKGKDSAKLRIKVGENASGTYKVTFQVKGSPGKAAKAKIIVG